MKTRNKALLLALCAILLVAVSVFGTLAYLTSTTEVVTNTFTVGDVEITLDEKDVDEYGNPIMDAERVTENEYKLIPGHVYTKDPTVHVANTSEDCWVFAKLSDGLGDASAIEINENWELIDESTGVYAYKDAVGGGESTSPLFAEFTFGSNSNPASYKDASITIQACAIQADGFDTYMLAWNDGLSGNFPS